MNTPYTNKIDGTTGQPIEHDGIFHQHPNRCARRPRAKRSSKMPLDRGTFDQVVATITDSQGEVVKHSSRIQNNGITYLVEGDKVKFKVITHQVPDNGEHPIYQTMTIAAQGHGNRGIDPRSPHFQYDEVRRPVPRGARKWPQYGGVVAINERNAKRKFNSLKKQA